MLCKPPMLSSPRSEIEDLDRELWLSQEKTRELLKFFTEQKDDLVEDIAGLAWSENEKLILYRNKGVELATIRKVINYVKCGKYS